MSRRVIVEVDKLKGMDFPPSKVKHDGEEFLLKSIFKSAGLDLDILEDETDIPHLHSSSVGYNLRECKSLCLPTENPLQMTGIGLLTWS